MTEPIKARILLVEDSATQARRLAAVLEAAGHAVTAAADGVDGLRHFARSDFDLVLSDVLMPGLSGFEFCRAVKADPRGESVPVILLTSLSRPIDLLRGLECGAENYLQKPVAPEAVLDRVRTVLADRADRAERRGAPAGPDEVRYHGQTLVIAAGKGQILDYLGTALEDADRSRRREYECELARQKQFVGTETARLREESLVREREVLDRMHRFVQATLDALSTRIAILDAGGTVLAVNAAWRRPSAGDPLGLGTPAEGRNILDGCAGLDADRMSAVAAVAAGVRAVTERRCEDYAGEMRCDGPEGDQWFGVRVTRFDVDGPVRVVVALEDVSARKAAEHRLVHEAHHDVLTGLPNRALFTERLGRAMARGRRPGGEAFAVLFLDLDGFKVVNDSLGHHAGDELLVGIGRRLEACLRGGDTVARLGGDEFAVLVHDVAGADDARRLVDRIRGELARPFAGGGHELYASASIGIALYDRRYECPADVLRDADTAMYRAKALGKCQHVVFDQAMHTHAVDRLRLETDLRRALDRQEFWVAYQPIVELATGRVAGFEALARWRHPDRGSVPPSEFIPAAEETGLIIPLDIWVFREACLQMAEWHARFPADPPLLLSVNLSSRQIARADLLDRIDGTLAETGIDPTCLRLEVTEGALMARPDAAAAKLLQIKQRGISLSMDDFGTGYSSLSYLHKFPFNVLKIDRSFIGLIGPGGENGEVVATIVALAHNLGMEVVAEGLETAEQVAHLRSLNCRFGQGFVFSPPVPAGAAGELVLAPESAALCLNG